jgi:hypothetical protein
MFSFINLLASDFTPNDIAKFFNSKEDSVNIRQFDLQQIDGFNLPKVYGKIRLEGNWLWQSTVRSQVVRSGSSGLGLLSQALSMISGLNIFGAAGKQTTDVLYFQDFEVAICEGEVQSLDGVYLGEDWMDISRFNYNFYNGTSTQDKYKNVAYIRFNNFPLHEFSNVIPNFTFEITRKPHYSKNDVADLVKGITVIPGSGEFVLDTKIQSKYAIEYGRKAYFLGYSNYNSLDAKSNALVSLDRMKAEFPNLEWVSPVICWFGTSLDVKNCQITPRVEEQYISTAPDEWSVRGVGRNGTNLISFDDKDRPNYGGTVADIAVVRYLQELKRRGYKVIFYPMVFMDLPGKPWRGRLSGNYADVSSFFSKQNGYNQFILHYANLTKGLVDAFVIGSEMVGLTSITDGNGNFPAVNEFKNLAGLVRGVLGSGVKITYAADWSEYHHTNGGWYNLDPLWMDANIDFIGIDAYFPLTNDVTESPSVEQIMQGWNSGEGYDFYYSDGQRTQKEPLGAAYAWKNLRWFIENEHWNPNGQKSVWRPKSKKIWFTEYGFPSVDGAANQPNVFYNPEAVDGSFPRKSKGLVDFTAQKNAIAATEQFWANNSDIVEQKNLWTYDARPYPFFPALDSVWSDGNLWQYGHWVNGKFSQSNLADLVGDLLTASGFERSEFDVNLLQNITINGFKINSNKSLSDILSTLAMIYNFVYYEQNGVLIFASTDLLEAVDIDPSDILFTNDDKLIDLTTQTKFKTSFNSLEITYTDVSNYKQSVVNFKHFLPSEKEIRLDFDFRNFCFTQDQASQIVNKIFWTLNTMQHAISFSLPIEPYMNLKNNAFAVIEGKKFYIAKLTQDFENNIIQIEANLFELTQNAIQTQIINPILPAYRSFANSQIICFETLQSPSEESADNLRVFVAVFSLDANWQSANLWLKNPQDSSWSIVKNINNQAIIGTYLEGLSTDINPIIIDKKSKIRLKAGSINLTDHIITDANFYSYTNTQNVIYLNGNLIKFKNIKHLIDDIYEISEIIYLLKAKTQDGLQNLVIFLDNNIQEIYLPKTYKNTTISFKAVSKNQPFEGTREVKYTTTGQNLDPYPVVITTQEFNEDGDLVLEWLPTSPSLSQNGWDVDVTAQKYAIYINGRYITQTYEATFTYLKINQIVDFTAPLLPSTLTSVLILSKKA